jgi:adenylate cyclase
MLTLPRFFALAVAIATAFAALALGAALRSAGRAVVETSESARRAEAARVAEAVERELSEGELAIADFEQALGAALVDTGDRESCRRYLASALIARRDLTELTLTAARLEHYAEDDAAVLAPGGRWQVRALRDRSGGISTRIVDASAGADPTEHPTFQTAANAQWRGRALWSDLAYSELDAALPVSAQRKVLTIQKAVLRGGAFVGVLRAGISGDRLDEIARASRAGADHFIFIADPLGRLVTRLSPDDAYDTVDAEGRRDPDGDLRAIPRTLPAPVAAALGFARAGKTEGRAVVGGEPQLVTIIPVAQGRAQDWRVGVVVPERAYVGALEASRRRLMMMLVAVVVALAGLGYVGARAVDGGVRSLIASTDRMRRFSFEPSPARSPFAEIRRAMESVERAKTALRAMGKYVPLPLVRRLYESGREPVLGAELAEASLMFSDIAGFTSYAESLPPPLLAESLGRYLETATRAVEAHGGTVDKYIGDALMVLWNAPDAVADHAAAACRAALACASAIRALGESAWWREAGLPAWSTRFGLHTDRVLIGHFGAPDRLAYTAVGDGVNLAARLEGLNKAYGTTILVSDEVRSRAGEGFVFRRVDRVAVKGKANAVLVHELVGVRGDAAAEAMRPVIAGYEAALEAALVRDFSRALELLSGLEDGPSQVLADRCRTWLASPPPADWDGVWTARSK